MDEEAKGAGEEPSIEEQLDEVLKDVEVEGEQFADKGREFTEEGQRAADSAKSVRKIIHELPNPPSPQQAENLMGIWGLYGESLRKANEQAEDISYFAVTSSGTSSIAYTSVAVVDFVQGVQVTVGSDLEAAIDGFHTVIDRSADKDKAIKLMVQFGLDKPRQQGEVSPVEQFQAAHNAFARPASGDVVAANSTLMPMREAIETTLDYFVDRIPGGLQYATMQGLNRTWKKAYGVASHFKLNQISEQQVQDWAPLWESLKNGDLSEAKTGDISRVECLNILNRATLFVISLLKGMDPEKLQE